MTDDGLQFKVKQVSGKEGGSAFSRYRDLYYGEMTLGQVLLCELLVTLFSGMSGGIGLLCRNKLYPHMFRSIGRNVVFGRNLTIRHPQRITIGDNVIIDDNCVIDAKGTTNEGISVGDNVFIGRNTIMYCKNGNIRIGDNVSISTNCQFVSSNDMSVGRDTVVGAYSYLLSGGGYDYTGNSGKFSEQTGFLTKGKLVIGPNCWLGAGVIVLDAANVGEHCVIAAGAVVTKPLPPNCIAGGTPARVIREIGKGEPDPGSQEPE